MLRDYIAKRGESVYKVSKGSGVAYTTLNELVLGKKLAADCSLKTIRRLASYFQISIDELCGVLEGKGEKPAALAGNWEAAKKKKYAFPVVADCEGFDMSRVHPLKQREILAVYDAVSKDPRVETLVLFGGATTIRCSRASDIDLAVGLGPEFVNSEAKNEISEKIQNACGFDADIIWLDAVKSGSQLQKNIERGVILK